MEVSIEVFGDKEIARRFLRLGRQARDLRKPLGDIADDFLQIEREQFASSGARGGTPWGALKASTVKRKGYDGQSSRPLVATGMLMNSLTRKGAPGTVRTIRRDSMILGTRVSRGFVSTRASGRHTVGFNYPMAHQEGWGDLPERPPVVVLQADKRRWKQILRRYLMEQYHRG